MRIRKTFQGEVPENKIVNTQSSSQTDTYSCDFINNNKSSYLYLGKDPDIDTLKENACVYGIYGCTKAPTMDMGALEVVPYTRDWVIQRFNDVWGNTWQREFTQGYIWGSWRKITRNEGWVLLSSGTASPLTALGQTTKIQLNEDWQNYQEIMIIIGHSLDESTHVILYPQIGERLKPCNLSVLDAYQFYGYAGLGNGAGDPYNGLSCFCQPRECYGLDISWLHIIGVYGRYRV